MILPASSGNAVTTAAHSASYRRLRPKAKEAPMFLVKTVPRSQHPRRLDAAPRRPPPAASLRTPTGPPSASCRRRARPRRSPRSARRRPHAAAGSGGSRAGSRACDPRCRWRPPTASESPASRRASSRRSCSNSSPRGSFASTTPSSAGFPGSFRTAAAITIRELLEPHQRTVRVRGRQAIRPGGDRAPRPRLVAAKARRDREPRTHRSSRPDATSPTRTPTTSCSASSPRP